MDQFDRAQELEQIARDKAIEYQQSKMLQGESALECEDCGESIPEQRRLAVKGVKTCIACQTINEIRQRAKNA